MFKVTIPGWVISIVLVEDDREDNDRDAVFEPGPFARSEVQLRAHKAGRVELHVLSAAEFAQVEAEGLSAVALRWLESLDVGADGKSSFGGRNNV